MSWVLYTGTKISRGQTIDLTISRGLVSSPEVATTSSSTRTVREDERQESTSSSSETSSEHSSSENTSNESEPVSEVMESTNYSEQESSTSYEPQDKSYEQNSTEVFDAPSRDDTSDKQR